MPFVKSRYPEDWPSISRRIRNQANNRCEFCGAPNHQPHPTTGKITVLTVAHLDHDTTNNSDENLKALCQPCHLRYDAIHHAQSARETRKRRREAVGQLKLDV